jgi:hypothetical protein
MNFEKGLRFCAARTEEEHLAEGRPGKRIAKRLP